MVIATEDSRLKVLMLPPQEDHELSSTLPHLHLKVPKQYIVGVNYVLQISLVVNDYPFFFQTEVILEGNSSKPAFPVALGAGCEQRSTSSLDVCHQVMWPSHLVFGFLFSFFFFSYLGTHLGLVLPSLGHVSPIKLNFFLCNKTLFVQFVLAQSVYLLIINKMRPCYVQGDWSLQIKHPLAGQTMDCSLMHQFNNQRHICWWYNILHALQKKKHLHFVINIETAWLFKDQKNSWV